MRVNNLKRGLIIVLLISILITIPRIIRIEQVEIKNLLFHFGYVFTLNFIYWGFAQFIIEKNWKLTQSLFVYLLATGYFSIVFHFISSHFIFKFKLLNQEVPLFDELTLENENIILFFRGTLFSGIIYFILFYLKLLVEKQQTILEIEQLKKDKLEAQLSSLKEQISPHFLFNSLSTLRTIVEDNHAKQYINKLANVYRYLLSLNEQDLVLVKDELEFTKSYIYIIKERFEDAFQININLSESIENRKIPPLVLQLLIENALKHNEMSVKKPLSITIESFQDDEIIIQNTLQPKKAVEHSTGKGLNNIKFRYQILGEKTIDINQSENMFSVKIPLLK